MNTFTEHKGFKKGDLILIDYKYKCRVVEFYKEKDKVFMKYETGSIVLTREFDSKIQKA